MVFKVEAERCYVTNFYTIISATTAGFKRSPKLCLPSAQAFDDLPASEASVTKECQSWRQLSLQTPEGIHHSFLPIT